MLDKLREMGQFENTLILFASDNGCSAEVVRIGSGEIGTMTRWASLERHWANVSNTPFRFFKNYSFEGGICTPLIAHWPEQIPKGLISQQIGHFIDIMPMLVEVAGAEYPESYDGHAVLPMEGESLLPALLGGSVPRDKPLFWKWSNGRAIIQDGWKLVVHGDNPWELYNIVLDRTETRNLAAQHPDRVTEMKALWEAWHQRVTADS